MRKFLNLNYPFYYDLKTSFLIGIVILVLSTLFSFLFEPFDVNFSELRFSYLTISFIHSFISLLVFMGSCAILKSVRKSSSEWRVKNEVVFLLLVLILIGVCQFLIRDIIYDKDDNWSIRYLYEEVRNTVLVGALLMFIITSINVERLRSIYNLRSKRLTVVEQELGYNNDSIRIKTLVNNDDFTLNISDFIFAKSDKNYTYIFLEDNVNLKRISLKSLEDQLKGFNFIIKSHRSYLVNMYKIENVKGNTQGYKLKMKNSIEEVPVSRGRIDMFEEIYNSAYS